MAVAISTGSTRCATPTSSTMPLRLAVRRASTGHASSWSRRDAAAIRHGGSSRVVAENDLVVHFGIREHEWPGGSFRGFELSPGRYTRDVMFAYRLLDGRIERWAIRDDLAMIAQLGNRTSAS